MTPQVLGGIFRTILAALSGSLVAKGVVDDTTLTAVAGGLATIVIAGWSVYQKIKASKK